MRQALRALAAALGGLAAACGAPEGGPSLEVLLADRPAERLSAYGLFDDLAAAEPASGVVAYDLVNPLFSDHAVKDRYVFVPPGEPATYKDDGVFDFPVGTTLVKTFRFAPDMAAPEAGAYRIETRLLIRKADGWAAYPYVWTDAGDDAVYAPAGGKRRIQIKAPDGAPLDFVYAVPNRNQCKTCHQAGDAIAPIGPKARNLNHEGPHGASQIADWAARGILTGAPQTPDAAPAAFDASAPLEARARAYLDINCAHCHKADGSASNTGLWLDWDETRAVRLGVGKHPTAAGRGAGDDLVVIAPGAPDASILVHRMASSEPGVAMPELGRAVIDEPGLDLVRDWIAAGAASPDA